MNSSKTKRAGVYTEQPSWSAYPQAETRTACYPASTACLLVERKHVRHQESLRDLDRGSGRLVSGSMVSSHWCVRHGELLVQLAAATNRILCAESAWCIVDPSTLIHSTRCMAVAESCFGTKSGVKSFDACASAVFAVATGLAQARPRRKKKSPNKHVSSTTTSRIRKGASSLPSTSEPPRAQSSSCLIRSRVLQEELRKSVDGAGFQHSWNARRASMEGSVADLYIPYRGSHTNHASDTYASVLCRASLPLWGQPIRDSSAGVLRR